MEQLKMAFERDVPTPRREAAPEEFFVRTWRPDDKPDYVELMREAGFANWNDTENVSRTMFSDGLFFAVHQATGRLAATAVAQKDEPREPDYADGRLGWVACRPEFRGHSLGRVVCAEVTIRLREAGCRKCVLLTDDFRLPAIKIYLDLGWRPVIPNEEMAERWRRAFAALGRDAAGGKRAF